MEKFFPVKTETPMQAEVQLPLLLPSGGPFRNYNYTSVHVQRCITAFLINNFVSQERLETTCGS
jgi:hypothetical protein